jgi:putative CocE/NonD family hydrolase
LILGPWNHGGGWNIDPIRGPAKSRFDHDGELLRFFDCHLKGIEIGIRQEQPVHYFTMVEERWKTADTWPPPATMRTYYFSANQALSVEPPGAESGGDDYRVDDTVGTGEHSRWRTQAAIDEAVRYPDRTQQDEKLLVYTSAPLPQPLEVTGHPVITLCVSSSAADGNFFAYLEDVDEHGQIAYVTEGQLRAIHRRLSNDVPPYRQVVPYRTFKRQDMQPLVPGAVAELIFDLLPTSYLFRAGHRVRVALGGADRSHFAAGPTPPPTWHVFRDRTHASRIDLPVPERR